MILSSSSVSTHSTLTQAFLTFKTLFNTSLPGWLLIFLLLTHVRLNSCSLDSKTNLPKYTTVLLTPTSHSARNLGFIFDEHLTFFDQITALAKACYYHIRQLRWIRLYLDSSTACTIATSVVHSKLDYCNSLYYNLPKSQLSCLQQIQNSLARTVMKAPILCSLHWLRIAECIKYKLLALTFKVLTTTLPPYLHNLISIQSPCSTRSSFVITLARPHSSSQK